MAGHLFLVLPTEPSPLPGNLSPPLLPKRIKPSALLWRNKILPQNVWLFLSHSWNLRQESCVGCFCNRPQEIQLYSHHKWPALPCPHCLSPLAHLKSSLGHTSLPGPGTLSGIWCFPIFPLVPFAWQSLSKSCSCNWLLRSNPGCFLPSSGKGFLTEKAELGKETKEI